MAIKTQPHVPPKVIQRKLNPVLITLAVASAGIAFIPGIGGALAGSISHGVDRVRNQGKANDEMKARAGYYRNQVASTLGIRPEAVNVKDFMEASRINPMLLQARRDVELERNKENRDSALMNGGVAVAGIIPGVAGVAHVAKLAADGSKAAKTAIAVADGGKLLMGGLAGSALAASFGKEHVSPQEVIERIHGSIVEAEKNNMPLSQAVSPHVVFLLRVAQDDALGKEITQHYGKPFHKLSENEQALVMNAYPQLTNAVTSEANAVGNGIMPVQDLMARKPNLNAAASRYAGQGRSGSFVSDVQSRRAAALQQPSGGLV